MAQTISELEKERAKLLEAIEAQANQISSKRGAGSTNEARPHTLNDWLNAAEKVIPDSPPPPRLSHKPTRSAAEKQPSQHAANKAKASVFGVIIMLSLLLTILGVIYIAYISIQKEMQQLVNVHQNTLDSLSLVQDELNSLKKTIEDGGNSDTYNDIIARLDRYEQALNGLKNLQTSQQNLRNAQLQPEVLRQATQALERQMEARIQGLINQFEAAGKLVEQATTANSTPSETNAVSIAAPVAPTVVTPSEPVVPKIEQKVVKLVEAKSATPEDKDVVWLKQQNAEHFTLQLASMTDRAALETLMQEKKLTEAKIIPQKRGDQISYVLVTGSHLERTSANQASIKLKQSTGISPWIRRVKDLSARVE